MERADALLAAGKPVIVTKVGRSGAGERAAASHTASMAGWSAAYDAVFAKYGFIVSNDLDEAVTIAAVLTTNPMPKGDRVAVLTVSGGAGIWGADTVSMQGPQVPELSQPIQAEIRAAVLKLFDSQEPNPAAYNLLCHELMLLDSRVPMRASTENLPPPVKKSARLDTQSRNSSS